MNMLDRVDLNPLEQGLAERFMKDPETVNQRMSDLLKKLIAKNADDKYKIKMINKVLPLFDKHAFWDSQPVPRFTEYLDVSMYDKPVVTQTIDEISREPLKLPDGFEWSNLDLNNDEHANELYVLLNQHYVEDTNGKFRFDY